MGGSMNPLGMVSGLFGSGGSTGNSWLRQAFAKGRALGQPTEAKPDAAPEGQVKTNTSGFGLGGNRSGTFGGGEGDSGPGKNRRRDNILRIGASRASKELLGD